MLLLSPPTGDLGGVIIGNYKITIYPGTAYVLRSAAKFNMARMALGNGIFRISASVKKRTGFLPELIGDCISHAIIRVSHT